MREGWDYKKLGELATYINGYPFKPSDWKEEGKPIIRIQNLTGTQEHFNRCNRKDIPKKYYVVKGDILISWSATLGVYEWNSENALLNQHIFKVVFDKIEINKSYFKYAILNSIDEMSRHTNGATMRHIRKGDFDNIDILFPPLIEQQRIVGILDAEFEKIDALKANAEKNLQNAKDLFQSALKKELEPKEGWSIYSIRDIASMITKGASPKWQGNRYVTSDGILFITSENVREGYLDVSSPKYVDTSFNIKQKRSILKKYDVLVNIVGASIGRAAIFDIDIDNANINQAVALIRLKDIVLPQYLCYYLNSSMAEQFYSSMKKDTARANLSLENISDIEIPCPKGKENQKTIINRLLKEQLICNHIETNYNRTIALCDDLKQALLRKAFSGEL